MSDPGYMTRRLSPHGVVRADLAPSPAGPSSLADILERVLDKGIVIAGDIQINLLDIELLTIKIRLLVASVDRAKEMGINWWEGDPTLSSSARELERENEDLRARLERLEQRVELMPATEDAQAAAAEEKGARSGEGRRKNSTAKSETKVEETSRKSVTEVRR